MSNIKLKSFAYQLVSNYANFDAYNEQYDLFLDDLPDFVQHEFASLIMSEDNMRAQESTCADNPLYESKMLPALNRYLHDTTDKDEEIEFNRVWRECITNYSKPLMKELIDDALLDYNSYKSLPDKNIWGIYDNARI